MKKWLVLVGGGGCGRWQAGALSSLLDAGLLKDLDGIVGTSVGGLNACCLAASLAQGRGIGVVKEAWDRIGRDEDVYTPSLVSFNWLKPWQFWPMAAAFLGRPGLCSVDPLRKIVADVMGEWTTDQIEKKTGIKLRTRAFNYRAGREDTLKGRLQDMALSTSAIEVAFPSHKGYGDGGVADNAPMDVAVNAGADRILVVYCSPEPDKSPRPEIVLDGSEPELTGTALDNAKTVLASLTSANEDLVDQAAAEAVRGGCQVVHCFPVSDTGSALDFTPRGLWERGVTEASRAIGEARALGWTN
jgi:predicted acylesterase/phospholipase RssA